MDVHRRVRSRRAAVMFERLFEPVRVGTMELHNRILVPTHAAGVGRILGSEKDAERFIAYYVRRARGGAAWIGGSSTFLRSPVIPGYEPTGRRRRDARLVSPPAVRRAPQALHGRAARGGACGTVQMIIQGGLPAWRLAGGQRVRLPGRAARADARGDRRARRGVRRGRRGRRWRPRSTAWRSTPTTTTCSSSSCRRSRTSATTSTAGRWRTGCGS